MKTAEPPEGRALLAAVVACAALAPLLPPPGPTACASAAAIASVIAIVRRRRHAAAAGVFVSVFLILRASATLPSQVTLAAALVAYAVTLRTFGLRGAGGWMRLGSMDRGVWLLTFGFTAVAAAALLVWYAAIRPDLRDLLAAFVPDQPLPVLLAGGLLFAAVNAALEEAAFRGVLQHALDSGFGPAVALIGQAVAFGAIHFPAGFPRGALGAALAFVYGLMMGALRLRARGMLAPWVAHVATDAVIVAIVLFLVR